MIHIEFSVFLENGEMLAETAFPPSDAALRAMVPDFAGVGGALTLRSAGAADTIFVDTLRILIDRFCLGGLAALLREERQVISFFDHEETCRLSFAGAQITLSGDQIETRTLPLAEYEAAQKACGERYLAVARRLWPDNQPAWLATLEGELQD